MFYNKFLHYIFLFLIVWLSPTWKYAYADDGTQKMNDRLAFDLFGRGRDTENGIVQPIRQQMTEAVAAAEMKRSVNRTYTYVR